MTLVGDARDAVSAAVRQHGVRSEQAHRPWPAPDRPWFMGQSWEQLLFAHWPVEPGDLRPHVHPALTLDTFGDRAWIAVTPFRVVGFRLRRTLPPPLLAIFPEINVRTYTTIDGKPGIYFFSLDAARRLAVESARRLYRLPYFHARMRVSRGAGRVAYHSRRIQSDGPPAEFRAGYGPTGPVFEAQPGTLEHWLTERYCLYTVDDDQRVHRAEIHHPPWPLQEATARIDVNTMAQPFGPDLDDEPLLHYAERQDVIFWLPKPVSP